MKPVQVFTVPLVIACVALAMAACSAPAGPGDEGEITINFGGGGRAAAWPPTDANGALPALEHRVRVQNGMTIIDRTFDKGATSGTVRVHPGVWNVTVEAWWDGILFSSGKSEVEVRGGGGRARVSINMQKTDVTFFAAAAYEDWESDIEEIIKGGSNKTYVITVTRDFSVPTTDFSLSNATNVTVTIRGNHTVSLDNGSQGSLIDVYSGWKVILQDIDLQGTTSNNTSLVRVLSGGSLTMSGSASVYNNTNNETDLGGGGVFVQGGSFAMQGSASVSRNTASQNGGGVLMKDGRFVMSDSASVSGNTANGDGGGVYLAKSTATSPPPKAYFAMSDSASVSGNTADNGGGVYVEGTGTIYDKSIDFVMSGTASVSGNTAQNSGGGVAVVSGIFAMKDSAVVSGNTADEGGGVYMNTLGSTLSYFWMAGGTVYGNDVDIPLKNTSTSTLGAALYRFNGTAEYGTFNAGGVWNSGGDILPSGSNSTDATIRVVNGVKKP